jgi:ATP-dependent Clp protease ATP-binding subunit ClpA
MLSKTLNKLLVSTIREVKKRKHEYITVEHLIYAALFDEVVETILKECRVNVSKLKIDLDTYLLNEMQQIPAGVTSEPVQTMAFQRVMQSMLYHVQNSGKGEADQGDLLASLFEEENSHGIFLIKEQGVERVDLLETISHTDINEFSVQNDVRKTPTESTKEDESYLGQFARELVAEAKEGRIDPIIGRSEELERTIQVLCRRKKNNPLFVGEPGVGKTAIAEGLALRVAEDDVPDLLRGSKVYAIDMGTLVAGTKYRGDFEKRLKGIIKEIEEDEKSIMFIDEIHTLVGAGSSGNGAMDASNILKPSLAAGKIRCMGATTFAEYRTFFEKDRALTRRFQKIDVLEPSVAETVKILQGLKEKYENHHHVKYSLPALKAAAELSDKHLHERFLPDKAIDIIDEVGASFHLLPESKKRTSVSKADIENTVSKIARIPIKASSSDDKERLRSLELDLKHKVFGQDDAIYALAKSVKRSYAGLSHPTKPLGSFLFTGPTGVGKTEVAKQLALQLGVHFARFDMSEYMEKHTVSKLIGSPPGYVGFEQGGQLTDTIRKHPHMVLLLDEIEKANEDLLNILLQVMDNATLTDNNGITANFKNVIIVMTSNLGASEANVMGFNADSTKREGEAIKRFFTPEFRNRLDKIISFAPLSRANMKHIVDKFIDEMEEQLAQKHIEVELSDEAKEILAEDGYSIELGARPLALLIQERIKDPISDEILFGALEKGGKVIISVEDDKLNFSYSEPA